MAVIQALQAFVKTKTKPPPLDLRSRALPTALALQLAAALECHSTTTTLSKVEKLPNRLIEAGKVLRRFGPEAPDDSLGAPASFPWLPIDNSTRRRLHEPRECTRELYRAAKGPSRFEDVSLEELEELERDAGDAADSSEQLDALRE